MPTIVSKLQLSIKYNGFRKHIYFGLCTLLLQIQDMENRQQLIQCFVPLLCEPIAAAGG